MSGMIAASARTREGCGGSERGQARIMSYTSMSHVAHMCESCHTHEWVMPHTRERAIKAVKEVRNESCHMYEWVMSHICVSHVTRMNKCCVMSHVWVSRVTNINES